MWKSCRWCNEPFETGRSDKVFCSGKCRAKSYRRVGKEDVHAEQSRDIPHRCQWCEGIFKVNEYASRTGKRPPKFCSARCRSASWRHYRHKGSFSEKQDAPKKRVGFEGKRVRQERTFDDFRDSLSIPRQWNADNALRWIYGNSTPRDLGVINKTCRDINKAYHPDKNGGVVYKHLSTINAAWDYVKRLLKD